MEHVSRQGWDESSELSPTMNSLTALLVVESNHYAARVSSLSLGFAARRQRTTRRRGRGRGEGWENDLPWEVVAVRFDTSAASFGAFLRRSHRSVLTHTRTDVSHSCTLQSSHIGGRSRNRSHNMCANTFCLVDDLANSREQYGVRWKPTYQTRGKTEATRDNVIRIPQHVLTP